MEFFTKAPGGSDGEEKTPAVGRSIVNEMARAFFILNQIVKNFSAKLRHHFNGDKIARGSKYCQPEGLYTFQVTGNKDVPDERIYAETAWWLGVSNLKFF